MANDVKKYSLYLIAIVGIVAIVGIYVMVSGTGKLLTAGTSEDSVSLTGESEEGDLAGEAIKVQKVQTQKFCVSGLTGRNKCEQDKKGYWTYKEEYTLNNCNKIWNVKEDCYGAKCKNNVGCCKDKYILQECQGNIAHKQIQNPCTLEIKEDYQDCSTIIDPFNKQSYKCQKEDSQCGVNCNVGEFYYRCSYNNYKSQYHIDFECKYSTEFGTYWDSPTIFSDNLWSDDTWSLTCPSGATCSNPEGKCAGPKTS